MKDTDPHVSASTSACNWNASPGEHTIAVGMSGGVDSSVAALMLKRQGYKVLGLFMKNWEEETPDGVCTSAKDYEDVAATCAQLDIPFLGINFVQEYRDQVFKDFVRDFAAGNTPNPDILCNREIKFKVFFDKARSLGADYLATGHYCQISQGRLVKGADPLKDQSYFLCGIHRPVLDRVLFPIGHLNKADVRRIAHENKLPTSSKRDSTGICFIGERRFREFLSNYLPPRAGEFRRLDGTVVGKHLGSHFYTIGQRRRLGLGGDGPPWFVVSKNVEDNIVFVERGDHPALYQSSLVAEQVNWLLPEAPSMPLRCAAKIRYRQSDQECEISTVAGNKLRVDFKVPQRGIAVGQAIAFYHENVCLGGAFISQSPA